MYETSHYEPASQIELAEASNVMKDADNLELYNIPDGISIGNVDDTSSDSQADRNISPIITRSKFTKSRF